MAGAGRPGGEARAMAGTLVLLLLLLGGGAGCRREGAGDSDPGGGKAFPVPALVGLQQVPAAPRGPDGGAGVRVFYDHRELEPGKPVQPQVPLLPPWSFLAPPLQAPVGGAPRAADAGGAGDGGPLVVAVVPRDTGGPDVAVADVAGAARPGPRPGGEEVLRPGSAEAANRAAFLVLRLLYEAPALVGFDFSVDADLDRVVLRGAVPTQDLRELAGRLARSVVQDVHNAVEVSGEVQPVVGRATDPRIVDAIQTAYQTDPSLMDESLSVLASGGDVRLAGTVGSFGEAVRALQIARSTEGVRLVDADLLGVRPPAPTSGEGGGAPGRAGMGR